MNQQLNSLTSHKWLRAFLLKILRVQVMGFNEIEQQLLTGRVLVTCNHISFVDGIVLALASPVPLIFPVDRAFSVHNRVTRAVLVLFAKLGFGAYVPMDMSSPAGLRTLKRRLEAGFNVMLFPEGAISVDGQRAIEQPGANWLLQHAKARRIDFHIQGANKSYFFGKNGSHLWPQIRLSLVRPMNDKSQFEIGETYHVSAI